MPVLLGRDLTNQFVPLVLLAPRLGGDRRTVGLIDDDELRTVEQEQVLVAVALEKVDAGNLNRVMPVDALGAGLAPLQRPDRSRADDDRLQIELLGEFHLPLVAQARWAQHAKPPDLAAVVEFSGDEQGLYRLAHAHVVGDEHPHRIEPQRHQERHELVGAGPDGDPSERPKRGGPFAQGEPRRLPQEVGAGRVGEVVHRRGWKRCRAHVLFGQRLADEVRQPLVNGNNAVGRPGQGAQEVQTGVIAGQQHPVAVAAVDDVTRVRCPSDAAWRMHPHVGARGGGGVPVLGVLSRSGRGGLPGARHDRLGWLGEKVCSWCVCAAAPLRLQLCAAATARKKLLQGRFFLQRSQTGHCGFVHRGSTGGRLACKTWWTGRPHHLARTSRLFRGPAGTAPGTGPSARGPRSAQPPRTSAGRGAVLGDLPLVLCVTIDPPFGPVVGAVMLTPYSERALRRSVLADRP